MASESKQRKQADEKDRIRVQGDLDIPCSAMVTAYAKCTGKSLSGAAIDLLSRYLYSNDFQQHIITILDWAPEENKQSVSAELAKIGVHPRHFQ